MRVVIAEDETLLREGLIRLLTEVGVEVVGTASDATGLLQEVTRAKPDVAIVDIRMPPTHTDDGLRAAIQIRERFTTTGVLVLSHHLESQYAMHLLEQQPERAGYLLKDRVSDVAVFLDALHRIADGECVLDPTIVARLLHKFDAGPLNDLTEREHEVLSLMAEGHSNQGLSTQLRLSQRTIETHVRNIFLKLGIPESTDYHRRVLAVLTLLRAG